MTYKLAPSGTGGAGQGTPPSQESEEHCSSGSWVRTKIALACLHKPETGLVTSFLLSSNRVQFTTPSVPSSRWCLPQMLAGAL